MIHCWLIYHFDLIFNVPSHWVGPKNIFSFEFSFKCFLKHACKARRVFFLFSSNIYFKSAPIITKIWHDYNKYQVLQGWKKFESHVYNVFIMLYFCSAVLLNLLLSITMICASEWSIQTKPLLEFTGNKCSSAIDSKILSNLVWY